MSRQFSLAAMIGILALAGALVAQEQQGGGGGAAGGAADAGGGGGAANVPGGTGGGGAGGGTRQPGNVPTQQPGMDPRQQQQFPEMARPIFLSGKVVLEDGTPPPESVVIERVCSGIARPEGYTDSKGRFSFEVGKNQGMFSDASYGSERDPFNNGSGGFPGAAGGGRNMGGSAMGGISSRASIERELMGCDIVAKLAGYRSEAVSLAGRRSLDNPDVGTIVLRRIANVEGLATSMTTLTAPKDARKAYDKGRELIKKNKLADAQKELDKAVGLHPKFAAAWFELGRVHLASNRNDEARSALDKAIESDPKYVNPYLPLAQMAASTQKWQEAADFSGRLIRLNPVDFPQAFLINGIANYNLKNHDEAEKSAREAVKLDTQHRMPKAHHLLGALLADKGELEPAAGQLRDYLKFSPQASDADQIRKFLGEIETRLGKNDEAKAKDQ